MPVSQETLKLYQKLRCADVCDALDSMGLQDRYELALNMRPLFPGIRFAGLAHTQEYDYYDRKMPAMSYEDFDQKQYKNIEDGGYSAYTRLASRDTRAAWTRSMSSQRKELVPASLAPQTPWAYCQKGSSGSLLTELP